MTTAVILSNPGTVKRYKIYEITRGVLVYIYIVIQRVPSFIPSEIFCFSSTKDMTVNVRVSGPPPSPWFRAHTKVYSSSATNHSHNHPINGITESVFWLF
jgi:hypothetical protein